MNKIHLPQAGRTIEVEDGQTVLAAALGAGISYPHGCRSGRCGACKSRLVAGKVDLLPHTPFALSPQEKEAGLILACRAQPRSDSTVTWLDGSDEVSDLPAGCFAGEIVSVEDATHDIKRILVRLERREGFTFRAGQYARLTIPGAPSRDYSMASRPDQPLLEFHIRRVPGGAASERIATMANPGLGLDLEGPFGAAFLREKHSGPILGIAGGSGLAPVKAIVETALASGFGQPIHVYFGVRAERDLYMTGRFAELAATHANLRFLPVLSEAGGDRRGGFVTDAVASDLDDLDGWKIYVAGPPAMIDAAAPILAARGARTTDIHADVFFTPDAHLTEDRLIAGAQP
jgi:CDP-4-dehydro-6-deoxyglucose reductase/ferredoxin-NAD(P)+ reductase (naphthalene dioxygenase ferredoxin-specific)